MRTVTVAIVVGMTAALALFAAPAEAITTTTAPTTTPEPPFAPDTGFFISNLDNDPFFSTAVTVDAPLASSFTATRAVEVTSVTVVVRLPPSPPAPPSNATLTATLWSHQDGVPLAPVANFTERAGPPLSTAFRRRTFDGVVDITEGPGTYFVVLSVDSGAVDVRFTDDLSVANGSMGSFDIACGGDAAGFDADGCEEGDFVFLAGVEGNLHDDDACCGSGSSDASAPAGGLSTAATVAVIIGAVVVAGLAVTLIIACAVVRARRRRDPAEADDDAEKEESHRRRAIASASASTTDGFSSGSHSSTVSASGTAPSSTS